MGRTILNIEKNTLSISKSEQQSLFTSNQEETDTRIALHSSESSKTVLVKVKDNLCLLVYAYLSFIILLAVTLSGISLEYQKKHVFAIAEGYICSTSH